MNDMAPPLAIAGPSNSNPVKIEMSNHVEDPTPPIPLYPSPVIDQQFPAPPYQLKPHMPHQPEIFPCYMKRFPTDGLIRYRH
jgi:hypothetical protein